MKTQLTYIKSGSAFKQRFQLAESTPSGPVALSKHKAYTLTDVYNTAENMVKQNPNKYENTIPYTR